MLKNISILLIFILMSSIIAADTVYLKNGNKLECEIEGETDTQYSAATKDRFFYIDKSEVIRIEHSGDKTESGINWQVIGIAAGGILMIGLIFLIASAGAAY